MVSINSDSDHRGGFLLKAETTIPQSIERVFPFFADALNLARITPPWLSFDVLTPAPIEMCVGQLIDYRLKLHQIPIRWRTEITEWEPPYHFTDTQLRGPYRYWRHHHYFEATPDGTRCRDVVRYAVPGGTLIHRLLVRRDVESIFLYREQALHRIFAESAQQQAVNAG